MSKKALQDNLKILLQQADAIRKKNEAKGAWDEADAKEYERLLGEADKTKVLLSLVGREEELKAWAHEGVGSVVLAGTGAEGDAGDDAWRFSGPMEGTFGAQVGIKALRDGTLVATNKLGEQKLAILKSGQYTDALNYYLRNASKPGFQMKADAMKVLREGQDSAGGFWVTPDIRAELVRKEATMATVRPNAFAFQVGSDMVTFPRVVYTTDDRYTSGVRFAWTAESPASDISESTNPVAGRVNIPIHTATAAIILTRAIMEDAQFDLLGFVSQLISEAFVLGENDAFWNGDGVGKPQGILKHPNAAVAHASGGMLILSGAAGAVAWGNATTGIIGTEAALPAQYEKNAKWYASKATFAAIRALNVGTANQPVWSLGDAYPNMANGMTPTLLGYPIVKDEFLPAISATATPVVFGDLNGYWIADRVGITVEVLRELRALRDEVIIYARKRVGAQLVHDWRVKLMKSNNS